MLTLAALLQLSMSITTTTTPPIHVHTSTRALHHLESRYLPEWEALYLTEGDGGGDDGQGYPMPSAHGTRDLLKLLRGVKGRAIHTNPGTTVSEGMGYAMLVAGMRKDIPTLKSFTVGWQGVCASAIAATCGHVSHMRSLIVHTRAVWCVDPLWTRARICCCRSRHAV